MKDKTNKIYDSRDFLQITEVYEDGIMEMKDGTYSKSYRLEALNYNLLDEEEKKDRMGQYIGILDAIQMPFEILMIRKEKSDVLYRAGDRKYQKMRAYYERNILDKMVKKNLYETDIILNLISKKQSLEEARRDFYLKEMQIEPLFQSFSGIQQVTQEERIKTCSDFLNYPDAFSIDKIEEDKEYGMEYLLSPLSLKFFKQFFQINEGCGSVFYLSDYPNMLNDTSFLELTFLECPLVLKIHFEPVLKNATYQYLKNKYLGIESDILKQQRVRNQHGDSSSDISFTKRKEKESMEDIMEAVMMGDEILYFVSVTGMMMQQNRELLEKYQKQFFDQAKGVGLIFQTLYYQQEKGIFMALPTGWNQSAYNRAMFSRSIGIFYPFFMKEIKHQNGDFMGTNMVTKEPLFVNRKLLLNGNGFTFGSSGSGKSFFNKMNMMNVLLYSEDEVFVIDPMNEYVDVVEKFGGSNVFFGYGCNSFINPLEVPLSFAPVSKEVQKQKTELMLALLENALGNPLSLLQKSVVDRTLRILLEERIVSDEKRQVTLKEFYQILENQQEKEAKELCTALEIYIHGSLDLFAHRTNIQMKNRFIGFHIADLKPELKAVAILIMLETLEQRVIENSRLGKSTWIYVDEFHELLRVESAKNFFYSMWKKVRKLGGIMTAITQNISDSLKDEETKAMINNSEFLVLLKLNRNDILDLSKVVKLTEKEKSYLVSARAGAGIIRAGNTVLPFESAIEKDNAIYHLFNTNLYEKNLK